jgi:hypothetical protein
VRSVRLLAAAAAIGASAVTVACGQQQGISTANSSPDPSSAAPRAGCQGATPARHTLTLGASDSGRTFCVARGGTVLLILRGLPGRTWAPVHASSAALMPRADGRLMLARWVTGASFLAAHPGTTVLSSMRPVCRTPATAGGQQSPPAAASCTAELAFRATIVVTGN